MKKIHRKMRITTRIIRLNLQKRFYSSRNATISAVDYCANVVRQHDHENFLATLLLAENIRSPALVLRAFNVEIAKIQDQTTDPKTAAFRLQFWQDAINDIYKKEIDPKNIAANPIAQELFKVCNNYKLPKRYVEKLVSSRHSLIHTKYFKSMEDLETYSEDSVSMIYRLILSVAGIADIHADHAASHLGRAQGIVNTLRSIHVSNYYKMVTLPMDILMKHQVSQENVIRGIDNENMRNVAFDVATRANSHLKTARSIDVPKSAKQVFLPAVAVDSYLLKLQKCGFNLFEKSLQRRSPTLPFNLYIKNKLNKF